MWGLRLRGPETAHQSAVTLRHYVYSFGGDKKQIDVHIFNTVTFSWSKLTQVTAARGKCHLEAPSRYRGFTAVLIGRIVYIWGVYTDGNVLYAFDVHYHRWFKTRVSGSVPVERGNHSVCVLGKVMYIHGGYTKLSRWTNDMYKLDTTTMVGSLINTRGPPPASWRCSTTFGTKLFVFGRWGRRCIRVFDTETNLWMRNTPPTQRLPEGREDHSAFAYNGELYIFGGRNWNQTFNDMWKFSPETYSWKKVEPKGKGSSPSYRMCCCMMGDRIVLFGVDNRTGDLYVLDLSPSLKALCKHAVLQYDLILWTSGLRRDIRRELEAMMRIMASICSSTCDIHFPFIVNGI